MTKQTKKILAIVTAAALVLVIGGISVQRLVEASAFDSARAAAAGVVPPDSALQLEERTESDFRFEYFDVNSGEQYKVTVDRNDRSQIRVQSSVGDLSGSEQVLLSKDEIIRLLYDIYPQSILSSVSLVEDRNGYLYKVVFSTDQFRGQLLINPQTGDIVERVLRYGSSMLIVSLNQDEDDSEAVTPVQDTYISMDEARVFALEAIPGGKIRSMEYGEYSNRLMIEVYIEKDDYDYEIKLDAQNGEIIEMRQDERQLAQLMQPDPTTRETQPDESGTATDDRDEQRETAPAKDPETMTESDKDQETTVTKPVSEETKPAAPALIGIIRVEQIVQGKAADAFIIALDLERDDGRVYYEGEAVKGNKEYAFEIDAHTGVLLKWNVDDDYDGQVKDGGIGFAAVKTMVLNKVPGAVIVEIDLEQDDGQFNYGVDAEKNGVEHTFEIDAYTGNIIEWEIED